MGKGVTRTIYDDYPEACAALERAAFEQGALLAMAWLVAFYAMKNAR